MLMVCPGAMETQLPGGTWSAGMRGAFLSRFGFLQTDLAFPNDSSWQRGLQLLSASENLWIHFSSAIGPEGETLQIQKIFLEKLLHLGSAQHPKQS